MAASGKATTQINETASLSVVGTGSVIQCNVGVLVGHDEYIAYYVRKGGERMKAFFEEYGLVLVVTVIATGMIVFSEGFKTTMQNTLQDQWTQMTTTN